MPTDSAIPMYDVVQIGYGPVSEIRAQAALGAKQRAFLDSLVDLDGKFVPYMDQHGIDTMIVRPDFYLHGAVSQPGDVDRLVDDLAADLQHHGLRGDYAGVPNARHGPTATLVVIPPAAGTGSEASPSAGVHPDAVSATVGMNSRHLVPKLVVLDPELTVSLPRRLTAATGIDALSHCIEGYLSTRDQPLGKSIALDGIRRIVRHLPRAVADGTDLEARGEMMLAAFAGGISIGMGLGPAHAMAITCSDQGFHHGVLSGIGMVASLDATAENRPERVAAVSEAFGLPPAASLAQGIATLMRELGLPATLAELGCAAKDLNAMAAAAERSHFNVFAPFRPNASHYAAFMSRSLGLYDDKTDSAVLGDASR